MKCHTEAIFVKKVSFYTKKLPILDSKFTCNKHPFKKNVCPGAFIMNNTLSHLGISIVAIPGMGIYAVIVHVITTKTERMYLIKLLSV